MRECTPRELCEQDERLAHLGIRALAFMLREGAMTRSLDWASALVHETRCGPRLALVKAPVSERGEPVLN